MKKIKKHLGNVIEIFVRYCAENSVYKKTFGLKRIADTPVAILYCHCLTLAKLKVSWQRGLCKSYIWPLSRKSTITKLRTETNLLLLPEMRNFRFVAFWFSSVDLRHHSIASLGWTYCRFWCFKFVPTLSNQSVLLWNRIACHWYTFIYMYVTHPISWHISLISFEFFYKFIFRFIQS